MLTLNTLTPSEGARKPNKRVGRGAGSGPPGRCWRARRRVRGPGWRCPPPRPPIGGYLIVRWTSGTGGPGTHPNAKCWPATISFCESFDATASR